MNEGLAREEPAAPWFEFSINPARAAPILKRLVAPTRTRARIFDTDGFLLLDTRAFYAPGTLGDQPVPQTTDDEEQTLFSRTWNAVKQRFGRVDLSPPEEGPGPRQFTEVQRALQGRASSVVRVSTEGQTIVYAAAPIQRAGMVRGVLLMSTQEGDIDRIISEERWDFVTVFLIAAVVMLLLSAMLAGTIAEPVRKLSEAADRVRRGIRARHEIPDFSDRSDEIGQLSLSLREMTSVLYHRIDAIERFAADVSHELKNPLTSLRSAVETLPLARNPESRERLLSVILHDVKRLDRLITDISDASRLDAELQRSEAEPVDVAALLRTTVDMRQEVASEGDHRVELVLVPEERPVRGLVVRGHDSRLVQVFDNLIENALSFSPPGGVVTVTARRRSGRVEVWWRIRGRAFPIMLSSASSSVSIPIGPTRVLASIPASASRSPGRLWKRMVEPCAPRTGPARMGKAVVRASSSPFRPRQAVDEGHVRRSALCSCDGNRDRRWGILISGRSKAGKSHLAEALLALARAEGLEALLVGDDRVGLISEAGGIVAMPHPAIAGLIERRGTGILTVPHRAEVRLALEIVLEANGPAEPAVDRAQRLPGLFLLRLTTGEQPDARLLFPLVVAALSP